MKKFTLKSLALGLLLTMSSAATFASTFYVCSGTAITLTAGGTFTDYEWSTGGSVVATTAALSLTLSISGTTPTVAETKVYSLRVKDATGCWSNVAEHTIYLLPVPTVEITDPIALYCSNENVLTTLTAAAGAATNLPAGLVYSYTWTGAGTSPTPATRAVNAAGTYGVTVAYDFTGVTLVAGDSFLKAACTGTDSHTITPATAPTVPSVTIN